MSDRETRPVRRRGGYNSRSAGLLLASVSRREEVQAHGGQPERILLLIDHQRSWVQLDRWRQDLLAQFILHEDSPPDLSNEELDELRARIAERQTFGETAYDLIQTVQEALSLRRFAGLLNGKYNEPRQTTANRVTRAGRCVACEGPIQLGEEIRFDERAGKAWHALCWQGDAAA